MFFFRSFPVWTLLLAYDLEMQDFSYSYFALNIDPFWFFQYFYVMRSVISFLMISIFQRFFHPNFFLIVIVIFWGLVYHLWYQNHVLVILEVVY